MPISNKTTSNPYTIPLQEINQIPSQSHGADTKQMMKVGKLSKKNVFSETKLWQTSKWKE